MDMAVGIGTSAPLEREPIYMDYHATTPLDPAVREFFIDAMLQPWGNPHGSGSRHNEAAAAALEEARQKVASLLGVEPREIIFTSGATEANNLALLGIAPSLRAAGRKRILISAIEHKSVVEPAHFLASQGFDLKKIPASADGHVTSDQMATILDGQTGLVSVMGANNEIGTIQPLAALAEASRANDTIIHSDLAQLAGRVRLAFHELDMASLSSHKLHGPMGVGALYVSRRIRRRLKPIMTGGGQEGGLRPGTVPVPLCAAFGEACYVASQRLDEDRDAISQMRGALLEGLASVGGLHVHGNLAERLPGNLNIRFDDVDAEALIFAVRDRLSLSTGSACTSESLQPSHVLSAIGLSLAQAEGAVRIGLGRFNTEANVRDAIAILSTAVKALRDARRRHS